MKKLICKVEIGDRSFIFDDADEAMAFAICSKLHEKEDTDVEIHILTKKDEEQE